MTVGRTAFLKLIREADRTGDVQRSITARGPYADWLEERGECEAAELIRVAIRIDAIEQQCGCGACVRRRGGGQHHNGPCAVDRERTELPDGRTQQAFLRQQERTLVCKVFGFLYGEAASSRLDRYLGTLTGLRCSWAYWRDHGDEVLAAQPVRRVELTGPGDGGGNIYSMRLGEIYMHFTVGMTPPDEINEMLRSIWPDVDEFVLPPVFRLDATTRLSGGYQQFVAGVMEF